jgi:hypothetical protein
MPDEGLRVKLADEGLVPPLRAKLRPDCLIWWKTRNITLDIAHQVENSTAALSAAEIQQWKSLTRNKVFLNFKALLSISDYIFQYK